MRWTWLVLAFTLAACAPHVQSPLTPPPGFDGPSIQSGPHGTGAFVVQDGARLPLVRWSPDGAPWAVMIALHGMNDSKAAFRLAGPAWAEQGIETWAYDQRGFGGSPGRGEWPTEALLTEDLRTVVALVRAERPDALIAVAGESMGGAVTISAFASDRPPAADRAILMAPAVWGWSSQSPLNRASLWIAARALGDRAVQPPDWAVRDIRASDNLGELIRNGADPAFIVATRFDALAGLVDLMESATHGLGQTRVPTLMQYGAHDRIITPGPTARALKRSGDPPSLRTAFYPDGWHILNRDLGAAAVHQDVVAWLRDPEAPLPSGAGPIAPGLEAMRRRR